MFNNYFPNRNYTAIYFNRIGDEFANVVVNIFTGVFFYTLGMPLHFILLYFGLNFLIMGLFSPLGPVLASKQGILKALMISYVLFFTHFVLVSQAEKSLIVGFFSFFFYGLSRSIYYPVIDGLRSTLIKEGTRGKQISLEVIFVSLASLAAVGIGTYILNSFSYLHLIFIIAFVLIIALIPLCFLQPFTIPPANFSDPYNYFVSKKYRENLIPLGVFAFPIIAMIVLPLFIFMLVGELKLFGIIIFFSILAETIITLIFGMVIDKKGYDKTQKFAASAHSITLTLFILFAKSPLSVFFFNTINKIAWNMIFSAYGSRLYRKAKKTKIPFIIGSCIQLSLCSVEIVALSSFALFAFFFGKLVFIVIVFFAIMGLFLNYKFFKD